MPVAAGDNAELRRRGAFRIAFSATLITLLAFVAFVDPSMSQSRSGFAEIDALRGLRDRYIDHFRTTGGLRSDLAKKLERAATDTVARSSGEPHARALYELGTLLRVTNRF
jgi:hypothetical protein